MNHRPSKHSHRAFEIISTVAGAFASQARMKIVFLLSQAPRSVEELSELTGESVANTSQHLQKLLHSGVVLAEKQKLQRIYSLKNPQIELFVETLFDLAHELSLELPATESQITAPEYKCPLALKELVDKIQKAEAILLDVRDETESSSTPITLAQALPLKKLRENASQLQKDKTYYLVCRGRYCSMASEGVKFLRSLGLEAYRLSESPGQAQREIKNHIERDKP